MTRYNHLSIKKLFKLSLIFITLYQPVIAADPPPVWSTVRAKGPTRSAFFMTAAQRKKRQDCLNKKKANAVAGAALGGLLGNKIFGGNSGAAIGAAAGGAIGASSGSDC